MSLNEIEQIKQVIQDKKHILITFKKTNNGDEIGGAIALCSFLEKMDKRVDIICDNFVLPQNFKFLDKDNIIRSNFEFLQKFVLTVDVKNTGVQELSYDLKDEKLRIFITPKQGFISKENIRTAQSDFKYDLIVVIGTEDLGSLGSLYDNNTELFLKTAILNIDHSPANEHFGQINLVDITFDSTSEIIYNLISSLAKENIDEKIATSLLAGIISQTKSFRSSNVKPSTLATASKLMELGANREYIVQNLYRTRSISTLKLWGTALSHMQHDHILGLSWTTITRDDFIRSGAGVNDLYEIVDELLSTAPEIKIFTLFHEQTNGDGTSKIDVILNSNKKELDAKTFLHKYGNLVIGDKRQANTTITNKKLKEVEEEIINDLKKNVL